MFLNSPWRGHLFIDVDIVNVGWHCPLNFLILQHDHIHNRWHDLWGHIKSKSQSSEAIFLPFYHNSLKRPEWSVDLEVGPSQIEDGNMAPLLSPFPQFLGTNIRNGHIHIYSYSVLRMTSLTFPSFSCTIAIKESRLSQLLFGVRHKPGIRYLDLQVIFVSDSDKLWNQVLYYFIFQWCRRSATRPEIAGMAWKLWLLADLSIQMRGVLHRRVTKLYVQRWNERRRHSKRCRLCSSLWH